nr:cupin domain-containing protein [Robbsia andropogonis]
MRKSLRHPLALLGGLSPITFMREYWQRKPLLIRQAVPEIAGQFHPDDLFDLAQDHDVESRLVERRRGRWHLTPGPFEHDPRDPNPVTENGDWQGNFAKHTTASHRRGPADRSAVPRRLGDKDWSLLVQGVDLFDDDAAALLQRFRFIPDARLDDLMISYAVDGGGVGPHFDSYDVFLLQAEGRRRWRISAQTDLRLDPAQPMKILRHFVPDEEWVLNPGDMLYLPPHIAHDGIAIGESITCSIGFRAADETELTVQFLHTLAEQIADARAQADRAPIQPATTVAKTPRRGHARSTEPASTGRPDHRLYRDPDQPAVSKPAALPAQLIAHTQEVLSRVTWDGKTVGRFLGTYLTEPKANVFFDAPTRRMSRETFVKRLLAQGLHLDKRSRMLYDDYGVYLNGETLPLDHWSEMLASAGESREASTRETSSQARVALRSNITRRTASVPIVIRRLTVKKARRMLRDSLMKLADQRWLQPDDFVTLSHDSPIVSAWHEWYLAGWIRLAVASDR